jgi:hypothetical protein
VEGSRWSWCVFFPSPSASFFQMSIGEELMCAPGL